MDVEKRDSREEFLKDFDKERFYKRTEKIQIVSYLYSIIYTLKGKKVNKLNILKAAQFYDLSFASLNLFCEIQVNKLSVILPEELV